MRIKWLCMKFIEIFFKKSLWHVSFYFAIFSQLGPMLWTYDISIWHVCLRDKQKPVLSARATTMLVPKLYPTLHVHYYSYIFDSKFFRYCSGSFLWDG